VRIRRALGLLTFGYAALHLATYAGVDQFFDWAAIGADITKRKFIAVGFATFLLLAPLAVTSTDGWVRRLGFRRWKALHRLVYAAALGGVVHFLWRVKIDLREPLFFAIAIGLLVLLRLVPRPARRRPVPPAASPRAAARPPAPPP
jgi:sulfoxide reductase heme-binding subunit YedZ